MEPETVFILFMVGTGMGKPQTFCNNTLGVGDGTVKDNMMRASSSFSSATVGAENGRVGSERGGGAWCPGSLVSEESEEWLEVELGQEARITGLVTQGRWAGGQGQEFTEWVSLQWWSQEREAWEEAEGPMEANRDTYSKVQIDLSRPVVTTKVRVLPISKHPRMVCLRVELLGCWLSADVSDEKVVKLNEEVVEVRQKDKDIGVNIEREIEEKTGECK